MSARGRIPLTSSAGPFRSRAHREGGPSAGVFWSASYFARDNFADDVENGARCSKRSVMAPFEREGLPMRVAWGAIFLSFLMISVDSSSAQTVGASLQGT